MIADHINAFESAIRRSANNKSAHQMSSGTMERHIKAAVNLVDIQLFRTFYNHYYYISIMTPATDGQITRHSKTREELICRKLPRRPSSGGRTLHINYFTLVSQQFTVHVMITLAVDAELQHLWKKVCCWLNQHNHL